MPNWVTHKITCMGDQIVLNQMIQAITNKENGQPVIDFNRIIPMPELVFRKNLTSEDEEQKPNRNWYAWSLHYWGTKWNACHCQDIEKSSLDTVILRFDTAWSPPAPIFQALSWLYPEITFDIAFIDEGGCFAGTMTYEKGELLQETCIDCISDCPDFIQLYEQVYQEPWNAA